MVDLTDNAPRALYEAAPLACIELRTTFSLPDQRTNLAGWTSTKESRHRGPMYLPRTAFVSTGCSPTPRRAPALSSNFLMTLALATTFSRTGDPWN
jgi:hypothetical protein